MKIKRARSTKKGRIEIIPMIDVMFFLLAVFMLASLSMQRFEGLAVNLAEGKADKITEEKQITISITHDNLVFLGQEKVTIDALYGKVKPLLEQGEKTVIIACDKESKQGIMMEVMLRLKSAGAQNFSIIAKSR